MIHLKNGNMFDIDADILVNTVNCVGVMGCGVALAFKDRYPAMFREYHKACELRNIHPGVLWYYRASDLKLIVNFPTKDDWRKPSKYEYIAKGLSQLRSLLKKYPPKTSIAIPALGCGHGGLNWDTVFDLIKEYLGDSEYIEIYVFQPFQPHDSRKIGERNAVHSNKRTQEVR